MLVQLLKLLIRLFLIINLLKIKMLSYKLIAKRFKLNSITDLLISFNKEAKHQSNLKLNLFQEKIHGQVKQNSKLVVLTLDH
jgi:hypothetical protein